ncbi:hypothetical protein BVRB_5g101530 [Beta vulgaris subsp. vulgaris]|uniref:uncharacterized protein LOC104892387 isoform X3 n=1 Tax=Beta vulgaris subsp. vulgaris TaxID=3555 RepID=UPI00053FC94F|nr:uncharacterized protein LOC104892387 isoform X3 [Beta vulgaris subsp. vulgaris]KMT12205.1 hypothetical protein BVRB_5g101530 [Beta vulgaris subsp. vulgaris]
MSADTAKENVSTVDSSLSQKHNVGNFEEPESSSCRANEDRDPPRTEEKGLTDNSNIVVNVEMYNTRYFIIKSLNHENIQLSVDKGIWATQVINEPILEEAFHNSRKVIMIFSVNSSGFFQGYAQMMSSVGRRRENVWTQGIGANNPWGRSFRVKWLRLSNLPFHKTLHLKNPLNEYKPVKISRDCQELSQEIGEALCQLIDRESEEDPYLKRDMYFVKRPGVESGYCYPDEGYMSPPMDMTWATKTMVYPSYLYQYHTEANGSLVAHHGSVGVYPPESLSVMASEGSLSKNAHRKVNTLDSPADYKIPSQVDGRQMPNERSPLCSTLSEDEFLEMSYEEYLEAHSKGIKQANKNYRRTEDSSSKEHDDDDLHSNSEHGSSHKKSRR